MKDVSHSPLLEAVFNHSETNPSKVALIDKEREVTYLELQMSILSASSFLRSLGLRKGDRILLSSSKEIDFVSIYLAAHLIGIVNVVVDPKLSKDHLEYIVGLVNPKYIFGIIHHPDHFRCYSYTELDFLNQQCTCIPIEETEQIGINDTADIMFTTGTTGLPKGVCLSHFNIVSSAKNINSFIRNSEDDVEVLGLPLSHSFGLGRLRCSLLSGGTIVLLGSFANLKLFFDVMQNYKATGFGMVPSVWQYIKKLSGTKIGSFSSQLRYIEIGSAAMSLEDKELLLNLFPSTRICMHYGLTEASRAFFMEFHENRSDLKTVGLPSSTDIEVIITDESGNVLPDGEPGEICIKGNIVTGAYLLPQDNEIAFYGDFFRTGDVGYRLNGHYYLTGRQKEMINVGGNKVSPVLIEDALKSLGFEDCACVAVHDPNGILGEVPKAYIVKGNCQLDFDDVRSRLKLVLEPYQIPVQFEWIDVIPRTSSGKIQRLKLI